jgi:hypothetical protein
MTSGEEQLVPPLLPPASKLTAGGDRRERGIGEEGDSPSVNVVRAFATMIGFKLLANNL